jgi:hypothetical protein
MITLVDQMLAVHLQSATAKTPDAQARLQRQNAATNRQMERLVFEMNDKRRRRFGLRMGSV